MEAIEKVRFLKIKLADPLKLKLADPLKLLPHATLLHPCTMGDRGGFYKKQSD